MNANGLCLAIMGVWVVCQVFSGAALERLKLVPS